MTARVVAHHIVADRRARGADARLQTPPSLHSGWTPADDRPDPVDLLEVRNATREPDLIPVRYGRMMASPFTFYRGAARTMATDLAGTPTAGLTTQLCGDAHLSNSGVFASPERALLFDLNDFDEMLGAALLTLTSLAFTADLPHGAARRKPAKAEGDTTADV